MRQGPVLVYAGKGSSHSWTWFADLLESRNVFDARFVDERALASMLEEGVSAVIMSGGDGFEMASALASRGFAATEEHVRAGGMYVGVCAGAYLPLPSRIEPFGSFNLSTTRIRNLTLKRVEALEESPRVRVAYGSCNIIHPVRGEVELDDGCNLILAPIYGGPVFCEPEVDRVALRYSAFTPRTSFQVEENVAKEMMLGAPAVVSVEVGEGVMVLAGPHLEHPGYPAANDAFMRLAQIPGGPRPSIPRRLSKVSSDDLRRSVTDLRIAVLGMERESFLVGAKVWDADRMLELGHAIEKRIHFIAEDTAQTAVALLDEAREDLLSIGPHRIAYSESAPAKLVEAARLTVDGHFRALKG